MFLNEYDWENMDRLTYMIEIFPGQERRPDCLWSLSLSELQLSKLKTSPHLSGSIKSWHFFHMLKKPDLAELRENSEESAIIWGLNEATQTVWYSVVSPCRRTVSQFFLHDSDGDPSAVWSHLPLCGKNHSLKRSITSKTSDLRIPLKVQLWGIEGHKVQLLTSHL